MRRAVRHTVARGIALALVALCALAAAGHPAAAATDLAQGRPARQPSTYGPAVASRAVDGNIDGNYAAGSVSHTGYAAYNFVEIDLGEPRAIGTVVVWNRTDCCRERLLGAVVELRSGTCDAFLNQGLIATSAPVTAVATVITRSFAPAVTARYVCVRQPKTEYLHVAEVQVFAPGDAPELDACTWNPCSAGLVCSDLPGPEASADGRTCGCATGYQLTGGVCTDVDECAANTDGCAELCENRPGSFVCTPDDSWTVAGEPGFPSSGGGNKLVFARTTTIAAIRVSSDDLATYAPPTSQVAAFVRDGDSDSVLHAIGDSRDTGTTTEFPLTYTFVAGRPYVIGLQKLSYFIVPRHIGTDIPLSHASFAIVPDEIDLAPPLPSRESQAVTGLTTVGYGLRFARDVLVTAVLAPARASAAGDGNVRATITSAVTGAVVSDASALGDLDGSSVQVVPLVAKLAAGQDYRLSFAELTGRLSFAQSLLSSATPCGMSASPTGAAGVVAVTGQYLANGACAWSTATGGAPGSSTPLRVRTTRLDLSPPHLPGVPAAAGGGLLRRGYSVKASEAVSITAILWTAQVAKGATVQFDIHDESGAVVASAKGYGTGVLGPIGAPLTFTFAAGRTYRIAITDSSQAAVFPRRVIATDATTGLPAGLPYALGPLTVVGVLSSTPGEGNVAPTAANALAPVIELMLTPGSCTTYPADVMPSTGCR